MPIQLSRGPTPTLLLACVGESLLCMTSEMNELAMKVSQRTLLPVEVVFIVESKASIDPSSPHLILHEPETSGFSFFGKNLAAKDEYVVLVRPDGHVASIQTGDWDASILCESLNFIQQSSSIGSSDGG